MQLIGVSADPHCDEQSYRVNPSSRGLAHWPTATYIRLTIRVMEGDARCLLLYGFRRLLVRFRLRR